MGRSPCCNDNLEIKKGPWTTEEDKKLVEYVNKYGHGSWRALPKLAGLNRCGKSCRLRWANYLRPDIKRGKFSNEEEHIIIKLHSVLGNKWSTIAQRLPGRTDNEIKNYWNTTLRKKLLQRGIDPVTHRPRTDHLNILANLPLITTTSLTTPTNSFNNLFGFQITNIAQLAKAQMLQNLLQVLRTPINPLNNVLDPLYHPIYNSFTRSGTSFEGLANIPESFAPHQSPFVSSSSSLDLYQTSQLAQTPTETAVFSGGYRLDNNDQFGSISPTEDALPGFISDSSECLIMNELQNSNTCDNNTSKPWYSSTTFDACEELGRSEIGDNYWKDILDLVSSPSWPIS